MGRKKEEELVKDHIQNRKLQKNGEEEGGEVPSVFGFLKTIPAV